MGLWGINKYWGLGTDREGGGLYLETYLGEKSETFWLRFHVIQE